MVLCTCVSESIKVSINFIRMHLHVLVTFSIAKVKYYHSDRFDSFNVNIENHLFLNFYVSIFRF